MGTAVDDGVIFFELDHGPTNTITLETLTQLRKTIETLREDNSLKGLVLTGKGNVFSSGFDLPMFLGFDTIDDTVTFFKTEEQILTDLFACEKPVVAAINGHCVAAGLIYALAADYRIASDHPKIKVGMSEIKIGLPLSIAQSEVVRFGLDSDRKFRDVMFFGEMFDTITARDKGIVDEVLPLKEVKERAKEIVLRWMNNPGKAFLQMKKTVRQPVVERIRHRLERENWHDALSCFLNEEVRGALQFMQSKMS